MSSFKIPRDIDTLTIDLYEHDRKVRNKTIDDFAGKLNEKCDRMIKDKWNSNTTPISWAEAYSDFKDDIEEIAEQLKAGADNGTDNQ